MDSYGKNMLGPLKPQEYATIAAANSAGVVERSIIYVADTNKLYYGSASAWREIIAVAQGGSAGLTYETISEGGATQSVVNHCYIIDSDTTLPAVLTLPTTCAVGDIIEIIDYSQTSYAVPWSIKMSSSQWVIGIAGTTMTCQYTPVQVGHGSKVRLECVIANNGFYIDTNAPTILFATFSKGYIMGGDLGAPTNVIEYLDFISEASTNITATLNTAKMAGIGVSSSTRGYIMGGETVNMLLSNPTNVIEYLDFISEASTNITATLDTAKCVGAGVSSPTKGYIMGGNTTAAVAVIEDLTFSTEASVAIAATLDTVTYANTGVSSPTKGYTMGGVTTALVILAVIEDLTFSTEASVAIAATLDTAKYYGTGVSSPTKGYIMGGNTTAAVAVIEDLTFSTEASVAIAATLDTAKYAGTGVSSSTKGYIMGGFTGAAAVAVIEDLTFSTEASVAIAATLNTAKQLGAGVSSKVGV